MTASTSRARLTRNQSARRRTSPVRTVRLELERLEERQMLAASPLVANAYRPSAPIGRETQVTPVSPHFQGDPSIAAFADGNYVVAWHVVEEVDDALPGDPVTAGIFAQLYDKAGDRLGSPITVAQDDPAGTGFYQPAVATDGTSKFIVTWAEEVGQGGEVKSRLFNLNGSPLGNEI